MSNWRDMTGFVLTIFALIPILHGLLVSPLERTVQHMRQETMAVASAFLIRGALGLYSMTTKVDGMIIFCAVVRMLTPLQVRSQTYP